MRFLDIQPGQWFHCTEPAPKGLLGKCLMMVKHESNDYGWWVAVDMEGNLIHSDDLPTNTQVVIIEEMYSP